MRKSPKSPPVKQTAEHAPAEHSHIYLRTLRLTGHPTLGKGPAPVFLERHGRLVQAST
jgi:hypothetical protein